MKKVSLHKVWKWQYLDCLLVICLVLALLTACADESTPVASPSVAATTAPATATAAPTPTAPPPPTPTSTPTIAVLPTVTPRPTTAPPATTVPAQPTSPARVSPSATLATGTTWPGKLVYDTTDGKIIVLSSDGGERVQVGQGNSPLFSPDGKRVAFVSPQGQDLQQAGSDNVKATITSVGLNGTDRKDLCVTKPHQLLALLRWSPRSRFIAFSSAATNSDGGAGPVSLCNLSNGQTESVMGNQIDVRQLYDWTPDGDNAVWQVSGLNGANFRLYYGDPDKSGDGAVSVGSDQYEVPYGLAGSGNIYLAGRISPDGKTLAVIGSQIAFFKMPGQQSPLDGKTIAGTGKGFSALAWSPDSQALAYVERNRDDPSARLEIVSLADGQISAPLKIADDASAGYQNGLDWTRQ